MNNTGTLKIGGANATFALNPNTALWTGDAGIVSFYQATNTVTHTLGGFNMGGNNTVQFDRFGAYQINRTSTFQNLALCQCFRHGVAVHGV